MLILRDFKVVKAKLGKQKVFSLWCGDVLIGVATDNVFKKKMPGSTYPRPYVFNWKVKIATYGDPIYGYDLEDLCRLGKDQFTDFILAVLR